MAGLGLAVPVLILRGEYAPRPARLIAETLSARLPQARSLVVDGAGHMGPLTRATVVSRLIADHVAAAEGYPAPCWSGAMTPKQQRHPAEQIGVILADGRRVSVRRHYRRISICCAPSFARCPIKPATIAL